MKTTILSALLPHFLCENNYLKLEENVNVGNNAEKKKNTHTHTHQTNPAKLVQSVQIYSIHVGSPPGAVEWFTNLLITGFYTNFVIVIVVFLKCPPNNNNNNDNDDDDDWFV